MPLSVETSRQSFARIEDRHKSPFSSSVSIPVLQEISSVRSNEPSAPTTWWNRGHWLLHPSILCSTFHPDARGILYTNGRNMNAARDKHCETQECEGDGWNCFIDLAVKVWAVLHHVCCHVDGWGSVAPLQNKEHIPVLGKGGGGHDEIEMAALNMPDSVHRTAFVLQRQSTDQYTHWQATQRAKGKPRLHFNHTDSGYGIIPKVFLFLILAICILTKLHGCERSVYKATTPRFCHAASRLINLNHKVSVQLDKHSSAIDCDLNSCPGSAGESHSFEFKSLS